MPAVERIEPATSVPASVTPRWSGYGTAFARRRYAATIVGTSKAFTLTTMSSKSRSSRILISLSARSTMRCGSSRTSPGWRSPIEPWFTPMRMGVPWIFARFTTSRTPSLLWMLPGLRRSLWTFASSAMSASR